jgi:hypothetical protein
VNLSPDAVTNPVCDKFTTYHGIEAVPYNGPLVVRKSHSALKNRAETHHKKIGVDMNNLFLSALIPLISLAGITWLIVKKFRVSVYVAPLCAIGSVVTTLYISDFLSLMRLVSLALLAGGVLLFAQLAIQGYSKRAYLTPRRTALLSVLILGLLFLYDLNAGAAFHSWDEFSHWGTIIKTMYYANSYHFSAQNISLYFEDYPPGTALFSYFFLRATGYSEQVIYFAHSLILIAGCLPIIGIAMNASLLRGGLAVIACYLLLVALGQGWSSALIDQVLSVLFAGALGTYWLLRDSNWIARLTIIPTLCFLALAKQSGGAFFQLIAALISLDQLYTLGLFNVKLAALRSWAIRVVPIWVVPQLVIATWNWYVNHAGLRRGWESIGLRTSVSRLASCCQTDREVTVISNFFQKFIGSPDPIKTDPQGFVSAVAGQIFRADVPKLLWHATWHAPGKILLLLILLLGIGILLHNKETRLRLFLISGVLFAGCVAYIFSLLTYYLYGFSDFEARTVTSLDRYLHTYELGVALFAFGILLSVPAVTYARKAFIGALAVVLILACRDSRGRTYLYKGAPLMPPVRAELQRFLKPFIANTPPNTSAYLIWQSTDPTENGFQFWIMHHELRPRTTNLQCFSVGTPSYDGDMTCELSEEALAKKFTDFQYVVVANGLSSLRQQYPSLFGLVPEMQNTGFFEVVKTPGQPIRLRTVSME